MAQIDVDTELDRALAECAAEPVHIPGTTQPFGCLLVVEDDTLVVTHASANADEYFARPAASLIGLTLRDVVDARFVHDLRNALSLAGTEGEPVRVGRSMLGGRDCIVSTFRSGARVVVEFEDEGDLTFSAEEGMHTLTYLMQKVQAVTDEQALFDISVGLLRQVTGFDRTMVYRFDHNFNGEVVAEDCSRALEPYLGLRFPHWDIPSQARDIMKKLPCRVISDVDQTPVPLIAGNAADAPVDISHAATRGVSAVHMEYLRNMQTKATMTLTIMVGDMLWGIISFHHRKPHLVAPALRTMLQNFAQVFATKLNLLQHQSQIDLMRRVDELEDNFASTIGEDDGFNRFAETVLNAMDGHGIVVVHENFQRSHGQVPAEPLLDVLKTRALGSDKPVGIECLRAEFKTNENALNQCAGALLCSRGDDQAMMIFRRETASDIRWAGNPEKTIEQHEGKSRLAPRGSFSLYLEEAKGQSNPWTPLDFYFVDRVWNMLNSVDRGELSGALNRQQKIMIDELNHRVRNILALVRSVSQQARRSSYGSLASYSRALEARIEALASSHDLASGSVLASVDLATLINKEFSPYLLPDEDRFYIHGPTREMRADLAPIVALVFHELVTNATKYGALANDAGKVTVTFEDAPNGALKLHWVERDGPPVKAPTEQGFGSTLIRQAIPHELNGEASLTFPTAGVEATFLLPADTFEHRGLQVPDDLNTPSDSDYDPVQLVECLGKTTCLLVEDNFVIAMAMRSQLEKEGVRVVEVASSVEQGLRILNDTQIDFAILDINLKNGETSDPLARELMKRGIGFFVVSGYGDNERVGEGPLKNRPRLIKPVTNEALRRMLALTLLPT